MYALIVGCLKKKRQNFTLQYNLLNAVNKTTMKKNYRPFTLFLSFPASPGRVWAQPASNSMGIAAVA
jgi:hypothetical protein